MKVDVLRYNGSAACSWGELDTELAIGLRNLDMPIRKGALPELRSHVEQILGELGFSSEVMIDRSSKMSISGMRGEIGLCFQTGNVARQYADLLKLELLFRTGRIRGGIVVVLSGTTAKRLGDNLVSWERLTKELVIFGPVITLPLLVVGIGGGE